MQPSVTRYRRILLFAIPGLLLLLPGMVSEGDPTACLAAVLTGTDASQLPEPTAPPLAASLTGTLDQDQVAASLDELFAPVDDDTDEEDEFADDDEPGALPRGIPVGNVSHGWLVDGIPFPADDPRFEVRTPRRAYCAQVTIDGISDAVDQVESLFPGSHPLAVGDCSRRNGGYFSPHMSHQTGLDLDLGAYWLDGETHKFMPPMQPHLVDIPRSWALLEALVADERVQYIILDYRLQAAYYEYARELPWIDEEYLDEIFQYPRGAGYWEGIIRHWQGHYGHFHVRFYCPDEFGATCTPTAP